MLSLRDAVSAVKTTGRHQQVRCPAHDDQKASLSIDAGTQGGVVVKCHAGCATRAVLDAGGLTLADLAPPNGNGKAPQVIQAIYDYRDESGAVLYQVVRYVPKDFRQRKPDGVGGYVWNLSGVRRVLYRLPDLIGPRVWLVEGEKDADRLASLGLSSTTVAGGGSSKWLPDYTAQLHARGVTELCVIPDNDATGLKLSREVSRGTTGSSLTVRTVTLPGVPPKGDVSDWLDAGHTRDELEALVAEPRGALGRSTAPVLLDLELNDKKIPKSNLSNAVCVLQQDPLWGPDALYYDAFKDRVLTCDPSPREWRDEDDTRLTVYLQQTIGMSTVPEAHAASAVRYVASQRPRHCVREYLHALKWDGEPRIATAFEDLWGVVHSDEQPFDYVRAVSANLFIGLVARVMRPGCQLDTMPVFEGGQGIGKSRALRVLGGEWYALAAESVASKDFFQILPGKWVIEIGEMDSFSKAERERIKLAISTPVDRYRASYGRRAVDHPRQCVFAGTTNRDDYGHDETGLRRFWPIQCTDILIDDITALRDQLFAEAFVCFQRGATWWEVPDIARDVQRGRQAEDIWTASILAWCTGKDTVTSAEVAAGALGLRTADMDRSTQVRISHTLQLAGWSRQTIRRPGEKPLKGFVAPTT